VGGRRSDPPAAAVDRGIPHLMVGFLFQNPIPFAYTNSSATPKSEMEFQPLISYTLGRGWYVKSADSTWTGGIQGRPEFKDDRRMKKA
jgi:hypothetical protein